MGENELKKYVPEFDLSLYDIDNSNAFRGHFLDYKITVNNIVIEEGNKIGCFQNLRLYKGQILHNYLGKSTIQIIFDSKYVYNPDPKEFTTSLDALYWYIDVLKEMGFECEINPKLLEQNGKLNYVATITPKKEKSRHRNIARMFLTHQALRMIYDVHNIEAFHNFYWLYKNYDYKSKGFTLYQLFQAASIITKPRTFLQKIYWADSYGGNSTNKNGSFVYSGTSFNSYTIDTLNHYKTMNSIACYCLPIIYNNLESFLDTIPEPVVGISRINYNLFCFNHSDTISEFYKRKLQQLLSVEYILDFLSECNINKLIVINKESTPPVITEQVVASL